jgi:hypothetical protein
MRFVSLLAVVLFSLLAKAEAPPAPVVDITPQPSPTPVFAPEATPIPPIQESTPPEKTSDEFNRFGVGYAGAFAGLPVMSKHGASIEWNPSKRWRLELSYVSGELGVSNSFVDLASMKETVMALTSRHFMLTRSFNLSWGLTQQNYDAKLGSDLISSASSTNAEYQVFRTKTIGLQLGIGNSWDLWGRVRLGIDYLVVNVPIRTQESYVPVVDKISNSTDRQTVKDAINVALHTPTAMVGRLNLAFAF